MSEGMEIVTIVEELFESNSFVLIEQGHCIIIDPNDAKKISREIELRDLTVDYIFLTHEHYDHVSGLNEIREKYSNVNVIASLACSESLEHLPENISRTFEIYLHFMGKSYNQVPDGYYCAPADIVFQKEYQLDWFDHIFCFYEASGHSLGSILIKLDSDYLVTGDSLLYKKEIISKFLGGNRRQYDKEVIPLFFKFEEELVVLPGHGVRFLLGKKIAKFRRD